MATTTPGIDVSSNNGKINWHRVQNSGNKFAFIKVNEGDYLDPQAIINSHEAQAAGLLVGGYNFLRPKIGRRGRDEFDIFYTAASRAGLLGTNCLRPVADVEATKLTDRGTREYVDSWINRCRTRLHIDPFVYTGSWFWDGILHVRIPNDCPLWLAAYTSGWRKLKPKSFKGVSIHQYTDKGRVSGISGNVDLDTYLSSLTNLRNRHTIGKAKRV